ncbi:DNA alkylation repair protein [Streptococcus mutans]|uniref:DNA alkylation repair protein n=1 Tax=Streptococcus mutans TaxID=1309 RepID=UPI0014558B16|nr:DNA alkylation repair protein [Streptococcus mutans]NLQ64787.1 DNA alkylation repair protein [Streptococcus mutans]
MGCLLCYNQAMDKKTLIQTFYDHADQERAHAMAAYMRDQFPFLGLSTPLRRQLEKDFVKESKASKAVDWVFVKELWELPEREFQYAACDYLRAMQIFLTEADLPRLKQLVVTKSWWDTTDSLDRTIGKINFPSSIVDATMLEWSSDDNFWLRRVAIDHQLLRKDKMKTNLLEKILINNLNQSEFFINKAIGWILRDYSKTNPDWVRTFIEKHKNQMANLSIKEASKYLR